MLKFRFLGSLLAVATLSTLTACGFGGADAPLPPTPPSDTRLPYLTNFSTSSERVSVMTWNVENLFDTEDDPQKDDNAFLPLSLKNQIPGHASDCQTKGAYSWIQQCLHWDWSEDTLALKLTRVARVIRSANKGRGPDILIVQEIENLKILQRLVDDHLNDLGYSAHLLENNDERGIDVGIITRLTPTQPPGFQPLRSRPALAMQFKLIGGQRLNVLGVHFPIAATPIQRRLTMLKTLGLYAQTRPGDLTIAAGDFNFPTSEMDQHQIIRDHISPYWVAAHLYCTDCKGSQYSNFDREWSQLDMILLSKNFFEAGTAWTLDTGTVKIQNSLDFQNDRFGRPAGFELPSLSGVSDHWPLTIELVKTH